MPGFTLDQTDHAVTYQHLYAILGTRPRQPSSRTLTHARTLLVLVDAHLGAGRPQGVVLAFRAAKELLPQRDRLLRGVHSRAVFTLRNHPDDDRRENPGFDATDLNTP
ncbi:hypothetical protein GCM10027068_38540 [Prescottella soli]